MGESEKRISKIRDSLTSADISAVHWNQKTAKQGSCPAYYATIASVNANKTNR